MRKRLAALLSLLAAAAAPLAQARGAGEITVFAAASLTNAMQEVAQKFTASTGTRVKQSFAASSTLARQIESGAGADIFASADETWMDYLDKRNLIESATRRTLLGSRLVLVVPADKPLQIEISPDRTWLSRLPAGRIATGDPAHVPVGRYAQQALTRLGVWAEVQPRLARADNARNALVLVERGEAAAGIVYATDAAASRRVAIAATFPESSHDPITYPFALLRGKAGGDAAAFFEFLASPAPREVFLRHGFSVKVPSACQGARC